MYTNRVDTCGKPIGEVDAGNHPASVLNELLGCPFCQGTEGVSAKYTEIRVGLWQWGKGLQFGEFENSRIPKTGRCLDCGKRVALPKTI